MAFLKKFLKTITKITEGKKAPPKSTTRKKKISSKSKTKKINPNRPKPKSKPSKKKPPEKIQKPIGKITHYFTKIRVGVIKVSLGVINVSDKIHIKGHTTDFIQTITSMQIDNAPATRAVKGQEAGIKVNGRVRGGDKVYKPSA